LTTWFLNLPLDEYIDNTKAQSFNFESKTHEVQLEDQKPRKSSRRSSSRRKNYNTTKGAKSSKAKKNGKEKLKLKKTHKTPCETYSP
jgi:hypothetical protein